MRVSYKDETGWKYRHPAACTREGHSQEKEKLALTRIRLKSGESNPGRRQCRFSQVYARTGAIGLIDGLNP